jgi:hypothetical protein
MNDTESNSGKTQTFWEAFASRNAGHPFLACEVLYSLTEPIIDAIRSEIPDFFSNEQVSFERDLARTASFGFFHGRAIGASKLSDNDSRQALEEREARSAKKIDALLEESQRSTGASDSEICEYSQSHANTRAIVDTIKDAFIGWLVSNATFRSELHTLHATWGEVVRELGRFPTFPYWPFFDYGLNTELPAEFRDDILAFYRRWGLFQMLTWEWPVPMGLDQVGLHKAQDLDPEAGVTLFVPWYLLRGEKLNLQEIVRATRLTEIPAHLQEWVKKTRRKKDEVGNLRSERMGRLYRILFLALRRRYPQACARRAQKLDFALSRVINCDEESVRKIRLELQRKLQENG